MKTLRKLTALLMAVSLLWTLWTPMAVSAAVAQPTPASTAIDPIEAPLELLATLSNGTKLCRAYRDIVDAIQNGNDYFFFDGYTLSDEEQLILQTVVDATFPESYGDHIGHSYCTVSADYFHNWFYDWGLTIEMKDAVNQRVAELTADLYDKSDFDKSRILYERLVNENRYDFGEYHQTAYGALIEDKSVCAGYARAYQMLLQAVGIPCLYVTGTADNGYEIGGHAWNIVKLDGKWYYSDPTWDDYDNLFFGIEYNYFNITYTEISADHFLAKGYEQWVPKEAATDANYYIHEGLVVETLTLNEMVALFKKHNPLPLRLLGDRAANAQEIINTLYANGDAIAAALGAPLADVTCLYYGDYSIVTLNIILDHDHDYMYQIVEPTCTRTGQTSYACKSCADRDFSSTDPLGHNNVSYPAKQATCIELGWEAYEECTRCGESNRVEFYGECQYETTVVEPTCTGGGCTVHQCVYCPNQYEDNFVEPLGHDVEDTLSYNENGHGNLCRTCNKLQNFERHGDSCEVCGYGQEPDVTAGDVNGDGSVNNRDLGMVQRYLNGWAVEIDLTAADMNGDGTVNNRDLGLLQRYLNGWTDNA